MTQDNLQARLQALEERNYLLETIVNTLPDLIYIKDTNSKFLFANRALAELLNKPSGEALVGKDDFDFFEETLARKYYTDEQELIKSGNSLINVEEPVVGADGKQGWISTTKVLIRNDDGQITAFVGIGRDITQRKEAELERQEQQSIIDAQRQILMEISTPIIPIMEQIIVMPLIGSIDTSRARDIMRSVLRGITQHQAKFLIMDITGVPMVDSGVADHLNRTIQAARLKGAESIVSGISDAIAETIVDLGINWTDVATVRDLQTGLTVALTRLGKRAGSRG